MVTRNYLPHGYKGVYSRAYLALDLDVHYAVNGLRIKSISVSVKVRIGDIEEQGSPVRQVLTIVGDFARTQRAETVVEQR